MCKTSLSMRKPLYYAHNMHFSKIQSVMCLHIGTFVIVYIHYNDLD
jgi:hypothetical protein